MSSLLSKTVVTAVERVITVVMPHIPLMIALNIYDLAKQGLSVYAAHILPLFL